MTNAQTNGYYKIISLDLDSKFNKFIPSTIDGAPIMELKKLEGTYPHDDHPKRYNHILKHSLETIQLVSLCNTKKLKLMVIKRKEDSSLCLGNFRGLININFSNREKSIRENLYTHGFLYNGRKYLRYKRSASSARTGSCLFILEDLKKEMDTWSSCGLQAENFQTQKELASWEAYSALTLSDIQETFKLSQNSILLMKDVESTFTTSGICVTASFSKSSMGLSSTYDSKISVSNKIWDGQCLVDESVFSQLSDTFKDKHMLLLRNRFFKSCGFRTKLQKWFTDNGITTPKQLNGYTKAKNISDIKIVITESSLKYLKLSGLDPTQKDYLKNGLNQWLKGLGSAREKTFGIVKTDKSTKYYNGKKVQTSYQFINTLGLDKEQSKQLLTPIVTTLNNVQNNGKDAKKFMENVLSCSVPNEEVDYYKYKVNFVHKMLALTEKSFDTNICKNIITRDIIPKQKTNITHGKFLITGTNATLFGNPIEFLYATIHKKYKLSENEQPTPVFIQHKNISYPVLTDNQVYSTMFADHEVICGARSPHITMGNLFYGKNTHLKNEQGKSFITEYFSLSSEIICINSISHNILERLNGADFDSDTMLITNDEFICKIIARYAHLFPVPLLNLKTDKNIITEKDNSKALSTLDDMISNNHIGIIVNNSQYLNSYLWTEMAKSFHLPEQLSTDIPSCYEQLPTSISSCYEQICELAIRSNLEIDKAKTGIVKKPKSDRKDPIKIPKKSDFPPYLREALNSDSNKSQESENKKINEPQSKEKHNTTLSHIYDLIIYDNIIPRKTRTRKIPLTSLVDVVHMPTTTPKDEKDAIVDSINRIKIHAAYYHLLIRSCPHVEEDSERRPDYALCSKHLKTCFEKIEQVLQKHKNPRVLIYQLLTFVDDNEPKKSKENSLLKISNLVATIEKWKKDNRYQNQKELLDSYQKLTENEIKLQKLYGDESYDTLLVIGLFYAKSPDKTSYFEQMILEKLEQQND